MSKTNLPKKIYVAYNSRGEKVYSSHDKEQLLLQALDTYSHIASIKEFDITYEEKLEGYGFQVIKMFNKDVVSSIKKISGNGIADHHSPSYYFSLNKAYMDFVSNDQSPNYKFWCTFMLNDNNDGITKTNVTSNIIKYGKQLSVSVSKSKLDKDIFVYFDTSVHGSRYDRNIKSYGVMFAKDKESFFKLKLALGNFTMGSVHEMEEKVIDALTTINYIK